MKLLIKNKKAASEAIGIFLSALVFIFLCFVFAFLFALIKNYNNILSNKSTVKMTDSVYYLPFTYMLNSNFQLNSEQLVDTYDIYQFKIFQTKGKYFLSSFELSSIKPYSEKYSYILTSYYCRKKSVSIPYELKNNRNHPIPLPLNNPFSYLESSYFYIKLNDFCQVTNYLMSAFQKYKIDGTVPE